MKVNQIVDEHKKGFRAKTYAQKPKKYIEPVKPQKPEAPVSEEAKITKSDASGVEITAADGIKTTLPPEKAAALTPDPSNPNEYDLNAAATSPTGETPPGPKVGANVEIKTAEAMTNDLSTMSTTEFVKGIYAAAAENGMAAPEVEAVKKQMVLAPNGEVDIIATMQKAVQVFQSPEWKQMIADLEALVKRAEAQPNAELTRIQELAGTATPQAAAPTPAAAQAPAAPTVDPKNYKVPSVEFLKKNYKHPANVIDGALPSETDPNRIGAWPPDSDFADLSMALDGQYYQARQADPNYQAPKYKDDWDWVQRMLGTPEGKEYAIANWIGLSDVNDKSDDAEFNRAQHKEFEKQRNARDMARPDGVYTPEWKYDQKLGMTPAQAELQKQKQAQQAPQPTTESKFKEELDAMLRIAKLK